MTLFAHLQRLAKLTHWVMDDTGTGSFVCVTALVSALGYLCRDLGLDLQLIAENNIVKLRARYPEAYSDDAAEGRADKGGATARES